MRQNLFFLSWLKFIRSANFGKGLATKIVLSFVALYFFVVFFILGISVGKILHEKFPGQDAVLIFNKLVLIYFTVDLVLRQLMQSLPTVQLKPLLILNIRRNRIIHHLLSRSVFSFFNLLPLFLFIPVAITLISPEKGAAAGTIWLLSILVIIKSIHFLSIWLKWKFNETGYGFYVFVLVIAGLFALDYFSIIDFQKWFAEYIQLVMNQPIWGIILLGLPAIFYALNFRFLKSNLYMNLMESGKKDERIRDFSWLNNLGDYGKFIALDLRLIWRNKRPRSQVLTTIILFFYGFLIYKPGAKEISDINFVLGGIMMISLFSIAYGQFFPAWHSKYFPMLMIQNFRMKQFLHSFYVLNVMVCVLFYLLTLPYAFLSTKIIFTHFVMLLYTLGVNIYVILFMGLYSKKGLELDSSSFFNYQGVGASQWLIGIPLIVLPIIIFSLIKSFSDSTIAFSILGALGLIGILLQPVLINYFAKAYLNKKHELIRNYKNN